METNGSKALAEAAAIQYVREAEVKGERIGAERADKLIKDIKAGGQSAEQSVAQIEQLKRKLISTSQQVQDIV